MSKTVFIAEKPAAALALCKALSPNYKKMDGYLVGENNNIFTWAFGHLVGLREPEDWNPEYKIWRMEDLPIIPERIMLRALPGKEKQLNVIKNLTKDAQLIVNFCDNEIEGELIFHYISILLKLTDKPIKRLWTSSLQPDALQKAFKNMKNHSEYQSLRNAGVARSLADWLIGINATRAATLVAGGKLVNAGRVILPVLALVYDRHIEREQFQKAKYYVIESTFQQQGITYQGKLQTDEYILDKQAASNITNAIQGQDAQIVELKEEQKEVSAPLLMDLTDVSRIANKRYGFRGNRTLELLQNLYLKKLLTYPRTNSRYVTPNEIALMHKSFDVLQAAFPQLAHNGNKAFVTAENKRICNVEKVSDHHALLPEPVIPTDLTEDERKVYEIVVERFFLQFHPPAKWQHLKVHTKVGQYDFLSHYKTAIHLGWQAVIPKESAEDDEVKEGYPRIEQHRPTQCIQSDMSEKETVPPPLYTDGSMLEIMSNISKRIEDKKMKEILKDRGIGTVATRADTIARLVENGYLEYDKKNLVITKAGITVIEMFRKTNIRTLTSPEFTAMWEMELEEIRNGKSSSKFNERVKEFTLNIVNELKTLEVSKMDFIETIGTCPKCKQPLLQSEKRFYCADHQNGCDFFIWRTQYNKTITPKMLELLLQKGKTGLLTFTSSKNAKYKAKLVLDSSLNNGKLSLEFPKD